MKQANLAGLSLRLQLWFRHANPLTLAAAALLLLCAAGFAWVLLSLASLREEDAAFKARGLREAALAAAAKSGAASNTTGAGGVAPLLVPASAPVDNLDAFYGALGQRRQAEQQVKTLFGLAARSGLVLSQGEYKRAWDRNARVHTYQVNLPVKGSYAAIWQFALAALAAIPFASLDDISFRRDNIGDPAVEARLRLTLYLSDTMTDTVADAGAGGGR